MVIATFPRWVTPMVHRVSIFCVSCCLFFECAQKWNLAHAILFLFQKLKSPLIHEMKSLFLFYTEFFALEWRFVESPLCDLIPFCFFLIKNFVYHVVFILFHFGHERRELSERNIVLVSCIFEVLFLSSEKNWLHDGLVNSLGVLTTLNFFNLRKDLSFK